MKCRLKLWISLLLVQASYPLSLNRTAQVSTTMKRKISDHRLSRRLDRLESNFFRLMLVLVGGLLAIIAALLAFIR